MITTRMLTCMSSKEIPGVVCEQAQCVPGIGSVAGFLRFIMKEIVGYRSDLNFEVVVTISQRFHPITIA